MKLVVSTDWHADKETIGVPRLSEVRRCIMQSVEYAIEHRVDAYFFLGDLSDPDSGSAMFRAIELVIEVAFLLTNNGIRFVALAGNHDVDGSSAAASCLSPLAAIERSGGCSGKLKVVEDPGLVMVGDVAFACLPFTPVARAYDPAKETKRLIDRAPKGAKVVVASHLNIPGICPGEETLEMPRGRECALDLEASSRADFRMSGHIHKRQDFDPGDGGPPIHVVGSVCAFSFGTEADVQPSFSVITL